VWAHSTCKSHVKAKLYAVIKRKWRKVRSASEGGGGVKNPKRTPTDGGGIKNSQSSPNGIYQRSLIRTKKSSSRACPFLFLLFERHQGACGIESTVVFKVCKLIVWKRDSRLNTRYSNLRLFEKWTLLAVLKFASTSLVEKETAVKLMVLGWLNGYSNLSTKLLM
jgi:hypothetical protein